MDAPGEAPGAVPTRLQLCSSARSSKPHRPAKVGGIEHAAALRDLDAPLDGEAAGRIVDLGHRGSPRVRLGTGGSERACRFARADRGVGTPMGEEIQDRLFRLAAYQSGATTAAARAVPHRVPVERPLAAPFEVPSAGRAGLGGWIRHGVSGFPHGVLSDSKPTRESPESGGRGRRFRSKWAKVVELAVGSTRPRALHEDET